MGPLGRVFIYYGKILKSILCLALIDIREWFDEFVHPFLVSGLRGMHRDQRYIKEEILFNYGIKSLVE